MLRFPATPPRPIRAGSGVAWFLPAASSPAPSGSGDILLESGGRQQLEDDGDALLEDGAGGSGDILLESGGHQRLEDQGDALLEDGAAGGGFDILLEDGGRQQLEDDGDALLEGGGDAPGGFDILLEDGGGQRLEDGGDALLEGPFTPPLTLREAIAAWLVGIPGLAGIGVYFSQPSQIAGYPCVVLKVPTRSYGHNLAGADGTSRATVEITALSLQQSQCVAAAEAVRGYFDGFRGERSGVAIARLLLIDEADDETPPPDGSERWIYQITLEYRCDHRVPAPLDVTQTNV